MNAKVIDRLQQMGLCQYDLVWVMMQKSMRSAWRDDRADWMMWLLGKTVKRNSSAHKKLVLLACRMASDAQRYALQPIPEALKAIRLALEWTRSKATLDEVMISALAARFVAKTALAARFVAVGDAADAAACAAETAARPDYVVTRAAWVANAVKSISVGDTARAAVEADLKLYARWIRVVFPNPLRFDVMHER